MVLGGYLIVGTWTSGMQSAIPAHVEVGPKRVIYAEMDSLLPGDLCSSFLVMTCSLFRGYKL